MVTVFNRSDWTTRIPQDKGVDLDDAVDALPNFNAYQVLGMVVHYTGLGTALSPNKDIPELFRAVQRVDMGATKGYSDIMYNFGINHFTGEVYPLRGLINKGAANGNTQTNAQWVSCLVTVGTKDDFDIELVAESLRTVRQFILALYPLGTQVCGHRDLKPTSCPGEPLYSLVQSGTLLRPPAPPEPEPFVCPFPAPTLQVGDTGPAVYELQNQLAFWGLHFGVVDGIYGNQTAWSVIRAQEGLRVQGLYPYRVDGLYGPKTQEAWCESLRRIKEG